MQSAPTDAPGHRFPSLLFAVVIGGAMLLLCGTLLGECRAQDEALKAYIAAVQQGSPVSEAVGGTEAAALTEVLQRATGVSITNFQAQSQTACTWVRLQTPDGPVSARFVLSGEGDNSTVSAASLARECLCPEDFKQSCHLR